MICIRSAGLSGPRQAPLRGSPYDGSFAAGFGDGVFVDVSLDVEGDVEAGAGSLFFPPLSFSEPLSLLAGADSSFGVFSVLSVPVVSFFA